MEFVVTCFSSWNIGWKVIGIWSFCREASFKRKNAISGDLRYDEVVHIKPGMDWNPGLTPHLIRVWCHLQKFWCGYFLHNFSSLAFALPQRNYKMKPLHIYSTCSCWLEMSKQWRLWFSVSLYSNCFVFPCTTNFNQRTVFIRLNDQPQITAHLKWVPTLNP